MSGNEPYYVHGKDERSSLSLPAGSKATSAAICVGIGHPTMRFFARSTGGSILSTLKVEVLFELQTGQVVALPIGAALAGTHPQLAADAADGRGGQPAAVAPG